MTILSDFSEELLLEYLFTSIAAADRPTAWYLSLHDADPLDTGADEITTGEDSGYARISITFAKDANNTVDSQANASHTPGSGTNIITHIGIWDAATAGNFLAGGILDGPRTMTTTAPFTIAAGDLIIALN